MTIFTGKVLGGEMFKPSFTVFIPELGEIVVPHLINYNAHCQTGLFSHNPLLLTTRQQAYDIEIREILVSLFKLAIFRLDNLVVYCLL